MVYILVHLDHFFQITIKLSTCFPLKPIVFTKFEFFIRSRFRAKQKSGLENMPSRPSSDVQQLVSHDVAAGLGPAAWFMGPEVWEDMLGGFKVCQRVVVYGCFQK